MFSNELSDAELERLALLSEELGELQQAIGKIIRHGYESHHPDRPEDTNRDDIEREISHVKYAMSLLEKSKDVVRRNVIAYEFSKRRIIGRYLHHQI